MTKGSALHLLHPKPGDLSKVTLDIIAVHGLNGHYMDSWTTKPTWGKKTIWLRDLLPEMFPQARIMTFEYNASAIASASPHGIADNARALVQTLKNQREDNARGRPIVFIGHSLGGLVIKKALHISSTAKVDINPGEEGIKAISECTKGIVFFGTPHRGSDDAEWADIIGGIASATLMSPRSRLVKALKPNSADLMKLAESFRPLARNYAIASFYEEHVLRPARHVIVDKESVILGLPHEETMMIGGTHTSMCKFVPDDIRFDAVWRAIRRVSRGRVSVE
ncbi:hypothetical protein DL765_007102 [Monosporascus sp. GIB2]|nr:hypothetical protein DL765_007102 [Monosporascus sp. GIB2]